MKSNRVLLLKTFLKASSQRNFIKYSQDKKKRRNVIANSVAYAFVYLMVFAYCILNSVGMAMMGMENAIPGMCGVLIVALSFLFTLLKSNGYLYGYKEYDMLVAMPFEISDIVAAKFLYMYVKGFLLTGIISLSMYIGYAIGKGFDVFTLILWTVLTFALPIVPMVLASALGTVVVRIGSKFKHKSIMQTVLLFVIIVPVFFINFIANDIFGNDKVEEALAVVSDGFGNITKYIPTAGWFEKAVIDNHVISFLLLIAVSAVVFELFFIVAAKSYRMVNSRLTAGGAHKAYELKSQKQRSMVKAIAFKEFKRMTGSSVYMTNIGIGVILALILAIAALFVDGNSIIGMITHGAPLTTKDLVVVIPIFVYFLIGMVPSTCCSPSLEGKNYWIMQSLPIDVMDDCKGKLLFNMLMFCPPAIIADLAVSYCFKAQITDVILSIVLVLVLCLFSSVFGLRCGLKHRKLNWDNEIEVVKQGAAVASYMLPNMFVNMILMVAVVAAHIIYGFGILIYICLMVVYLLLTLLSWMAVKRYAHR